VQINYRRPNKGKLKMKSQIIGISGSIIKNSNKEITT